jgi:hypothetical protein
MESALGIGYPYFTREGIWGSLTSTEVFIWRGMRMEDEKGDLVHIFPLTDPGKDAAGNFIMEYLKENRPGDMNDAILDAFIESGLFKRKTPDAVKDNEDSKEDAPKN